MHQTTNQSQIASHLTYSYAFAGVVFSAHFGIDNPNLAIWPVVVAALFLSEMARRAKAMGMGSSAVGYMQFWATAAFFYFGYLLWTA